MKMHSILFAAAAMGASALSVGLATAPAHAAEADVVVTGRASDAPSATIRYADLNLASAEGRTRLDRRIGFAARKLCGTLHAPQEYNTRMIISECQDSVLASAKPQVEAVIAAFESGQQLALGDVGALTLSAK
jgi:UrcA family protein